MIKKILYIAFKYDYGKNENGYTLNYKAYYENFIKLEYEVEALFYEDYSKEELQKIIIDKANETSPDLIFFILQKDQIETITLKTLKEKGCFIVNIFGDDQWRFEKYTSLYAPYFSACITTDKFSVDKYFNIGQKNIIRSQWASLESIIDYSNVKYKYDVSFIGGINPYRKWFVKELYKRGIKVHCYGSGWNNGRITYVQMERVFLTSKINLNISNSTNFDIRYLLSNIRNLYSNLKTISGGGKNNSEIKARNFEIPTQGGFQLTDYVPSIEEYFDIGKEIVCYNSIDEAEFLIEYYLKHEENREQIRIAGIKKARENHTFKHRIIDFMKELEKIKLESFA